MFTNPWLRKLKIDPRAARAAAGENMGEVYCITEEYLLAQPITPGITLVPTMLMKVSKTYWFFESLDCNAA